MSAPGWTKRLRDWPRTFFRRTSRWYRRALFIAGTKRGVRSLLALLAAGLSIYRLLEESRSQVNVFGLVLLGVSVSICLFAFWPAQIIKRAQAAKDWTSSVLDDVLRFAEDRLRQLTMLVLVVVTILSFVLWGWLISGSEVHTETRGFQQTTIRTEIIESGSTTVRNLSLVFAAILALPIAIWRTRIAQLQATTAQREHSNSLYREGAGKLVDEDLSVRLDGVHILDRLAKDEPEQYHIQIMSRLCAFLRSWRDRQGNRSYLGEDVLAVIEAIRSRGEAGQEIEEISSFILDLKNTNFRGAWLNNAPLSRAELSNADLVDSYLHHANLSGATFYKSQLEGANFFDAELTNARFSINGKHPATGLTQDQINDAWCDQEHPPMLDGVVEETTGRQLTPPTRSASFSAELEELRGVVRR